MKLYVGHLRLLLSLTGTETQGGACFSSVLCFVDLCLLPLPMEVGQKGIWGTREQDWAVWVSAGR